MAHPSAPLPTSSTGDFTAVLFAGGRSSRMGFDKATLEIDGAPLWQRQLATLRGTNPKELLVSGPIDGPYRDSGVAVVPDDLPGLGPLGGLATILRAAQCPLVLVLAIDLPAMTSGWLNRLLRFGPAVPVRFGQLEPLAALYPKAAKPIADRQLQRRQLSMSSFTRALFEVGIIQPMTVSPEDAGIFRNLNTPRDLLEAD